MGKIHLDAATIAAPAVAAVLMVCGASVFISTASPPTTEPAAAITTKATPALPPTILYDVPLTEELQIHIIRVAESYGIDPAIILAMCYRESTYNPSSIGDNGDAYGLMQIQAKWHRDRMARLQCTDLLDPYQNILVGTDYLSEQLARYGGDMAKALVAYNAGHYNGTITRYAQGVLATAEELRGTTYEAIR